ncbi:Ferredoxin subunit of nitrite reductase or a ring-hydroxylating dioxygenase [Flavobacterium segetis]|uniref:Ferredoxin subunit of nitrite reductase or a ring-hydroxylating dioxygenase n=1 Tax=Flavobacterium segetis TaxID=271157 RepID=A0A1M5F299_9FLAO|nr:Ferredoxin subunit of nitrite reductase or a ring-hydroxylating dioxygenase [Flavobacterium segetis]
MSIILLISCSEQGIRNNNPNLPNYAVLIDLNLNLPEYSSLKFVSNAVLIPGKGVRGVVVFNTGSGYNAFDVACPNQALSSCSTMTIKGINLLCPCDNEEYSLFSGQSKLQYPLKQYRVQVNGEVLRVYN